MNTQAIETTSEYNPFAKIRATDLSNRAVQVALKKVGRSWVREFVKDELFLTRADMDYVLDEVDFDDIFEVLEGNKERMQDIHVIAAAFKLAAEAAREELVAAGLLEC